MLKVKAEIALEFIRDVLQLEDKPYIFRHKLLVKNNNMKRVNYCTHRVCFVGPRIRGVLLILEFRTPYAKRHKPYQKKNKKLDFWKPPF